MHGRRTRLMGLVTMLVVSAAACGSETGPASESSTTLQTTDPPATTESVPAPPETSEGSQVEIAAVHRGFGYYGACGNETTDVEGVTFYPLLPEQLEDFDDARYPVSLAAGRRAGSGAASVVPPGPGDDTGTMIVYTDGVARFESDSGRVIWLSDHEQLYGWDC